MTDIKLTLISSLEKLYHEDETTTNEFLKFSILKNERKSFQCVIDSLIESKFKIEVNTDLKNIKIYKVEYVPSNLPIQKSNHDDYIRLSKNNMYPDLLLPIQDEIDLSKGRTILWIEVSSDKLDEIGEHKLSFSFDNGEKYTSSEMSMEIIDAELNFENFVYTNWFHSDCLMSYYQVEAFSEKYWQYVENYLKIAAMHGMNCVLTPVFTPPLDTEIGKERPTVQLVDVSIKNRKYSFNFDKLEKWINLCHSCNIEYFEISHLFTQWGANNAPKIVANVDGELKRIFGWETKSSSKEYVRFLTEFSTAFKQFIENKGLKDKTFIHVSDEPNFAVIRSYSKASKLIHKLFKGYKIIDALSDVWFYKLGVVSSPIPSNDHINHFLGKADNLWTYYCSAQSKKYVSNRFFCHENLRNRVLGYQLFKYDVQGFLHWGYNFYYTQLSKELIDPFKVTDAGGKFPSGDSFVVYPSNEGTPYESIRLKVFYDGLQDFAAANTLKKLTTKDTVLSIIEKKQKISFSEYPHENSWLLESREAINKAIKEQTVKK